MRARATMALAFAACLLTSGLALAPSLASAGDRPLELLLVNMSPASARPDCMRDITRVLRHEDTTIHRMGGDRVRQLAGHRVDGVEFLDWRAEDLDAAVRVVRTERAIDAIVLVDCRAEDGRASVWMRAPSRGVTRLRLSRTVIDSARAEWIARAITLHLRAGFSP